MEEFRRVSVLGIGFAGLPIAVSFGLKDVFGEVIGFDVQQTRIAELQENYDRNRYIDSKDLKKANIKFTTDIEDVKAADFHIVIVPTPVDEYTNPNLHYLIDVSKILGEQLKKDDIVVYESSVYPGLTEEICIPTLEKASKLKAGRDFFVGYSPERVDFGLRHLPLNEIVKVVAAQDEKTLAIVADTYRVIIDAGVHKVSSIKAAEATKMLENTQRDINIAFINEMAMILNAENLDTREVVDAAATKWNFVPFEPGLVGGHCISVDPWFLAHRAMKNGIYPELMLTGRRVNDGISGFVVMETVRQCVKSSIKLGRSKILVLGLSFKENTPDFRDTRVLDIIKGLQAYDLDVVTHDPVVHKDEVLRQLGIKLVDWNDIDNVSAIIIAVAHDQFKKIGKNDFLSKLTKPGLIVDVKGILNPSEFNDSDITVWRL